MSDEKASTLAADVARVEAECDRWRKLAQEFAHDHDARRTERDALRAEVETLRAKVETLRKILGAGTETTCDAARNVVATSRAAIAARDVAETRAGAMLRERTMTVRRLTELVDELRGGAS